MSEVQPESSPPALEKFNRLTAAPEHRPPPGTTIEAAAPMKRGRLVACNAAPRCWQPVEHFPTTTV